MPVKPEAAPLVTAMSAAAKSVTSAEKVNVTEKAARVGKVPALAIATVSAAVLLVTDWAERLAAGLPSASWIGSVAGAV